MNPQNHTLFVTTGFGFNAPVPIRVRTATPAEVRRGRTSRPRAPVLAPGSALGSIPTVALSSGQVARIVPSDIPVSEAHYCLPVTFQMCASM